MGGVELRLGGRADLLFVDTENYSDPIVGETDEKDPHFELNRLRLVPRLRFNRHVSARAQIDFKPDRGDVRLKEFTVRHRAQPVWWFRSNFRLGLDDRIIRPRRRTRTYPLIGNAFWRDESLGAVWSLRFGNRRGQPADGRVVEEYSGDEDSTEDEALDFLRADNRGELFEAPADPFDFSSNWGAVTVHLSGGQGPVLDNKEIGRDNAGFNDIVQDDRNIDDDKQISEVGVALEYRRDFSWLGDISVLGFFYHNTLGDESVDFLQQDLTIRDNAGNALRGYGDSNKDESWRYGIGGQYFFPASTLFGDELTRRRDGLRLQAQWIHADDGDFEREGWFVQASYRYSFPERLIAGRYFRSIEPLVRYGEMDTNLGPFIDLPTTWDRERWVVGLNIEVTNEILLRAEYAFNSEDTGDSPGTPGPGSVDNDELVIELRFLF